MLVSIILWAIAVGAAGTICELPNVDRARTSSLFCISCHDGSIAAQSQNSGQGCHPVQVSYAEALLRHRGALNPLPAVGPIMLPNGNVECTSCHDGRSGTGPAEHWLAISNSGSALCLTCHGR